MIRCPNRSQTQDLQVSLVHVFTQFHVPIRQINEMFPAIVLIQAELDLHEWTPLRSLRLPNQMHSRFLRCAVRLKRIALDARAHDVLPGGRAAAIARNHVVQVQILPVEHPAAVLARILVALENVMAREFDLFLGEMIIDHQEDHARDADSEGNCPDRFRMRFLLGEIMPLGKAKGLEGAIGPIQDRLGMTLKEQRQGASSGADIDGLPQPIQN
jgi:hypothetical protein